MAAGSTMLRLLLVLVCCISPAAAEEFSQKEALRLFGTLEFRGSLKALPNWTRVLEEGGEQVRQMARCEACSAAALSWRQLQEQAREMPPMEQLRRVNAFFNRWPYRLDRDVYGVDDYWASPLEFLKNSGDCEDFAIAKYFALRELGLSPHDMRIVVLQDSIRGIAHAVLAVRLDDEAYVLDNLSDLVFPHSWYQHYVPQYSVNEFHRWAHVRSVIDPH